MRRGRALCRWLRARKALATVLLGLLLSATGCFRVDLTVDVREDGSGTISALQALDTTQAQALLGRRRIPDLLPLGTSPKVTVTSYSNGSERGFRLDAAFADTDELENRLVDVRDALATSVSSIGIDGGIHSLHVSQLPSTGWRFELVREDLAIGAGADILNPEGSGRTSRDLLDKVNVRVNVRLPGQAFNHNADRIENGTFSWDLTLNDERDVLFAQTVPAAAGTVAAGDANSPWPWVALGLGVCALLAIAIGLAWNQRRTRREKPPNTQRLSPRHAAAPGSSETPASAEPSPSGWPSAPPVGVPSPQYPEPDAPSAWPTEPPGSNLGQAGAFPPRRPPDLP